jgi:hypothetical protein
MFANHFYVPPVTGLLENLYEYICIYRVWTKIEESLEIYVVCKVSEHSRC